MEILFIFDFKVYPATHIQQVSLVWIIEPQKALDGQFIVDPVFAGQRVEILWIELRIKTDSQGSL